MGGDLKVSVVIASWNDSFYLHKCLDSLAKDFSLEKEVIVVNDSESKINMDCLSTTGNRGPATAWNMGITASKNDFVIILNSDVEVYDGFCLDYMEHYLKIGHPCILGPSGNIIDKKLKIHVLDEIWRRHDFHHIPVDHIGGFCMLFDRNISFRFDEGYRLYYEDLQFCLDAWSHGIPVYFLNPKLLPIRHVGGGATSLFSDAMIVMRQSRRRFVSKWKRYFRRRKQREIEFKC